MAEALTLIDWAKRTGPDGKPLKIVEILSQNNDVLQDIPFMEANQATGHVTAIRTGLPTVYYRTLNQGVAKSKSTTVQVTEGMSILEARSEIDIDLAKLNGNVNEFRMSEDRPFLEAMKQKQAATMFYGNPLANPEQFTGLAIRYSDLTNGGNKANILSAGGSNSANTSIYLTVWGEDTTVGIFPKGSTVGLEQQDLGEGDAFDSNSLRFRAYMTMFKWKMGLVVKDWRFTVRICNIDTPALIANTAGPDLIEYMIKATHRIPSLGYGKAVFYMNRLCYQMLDIQARGQVKTGGQLSYDVIAGKPVLSFRGIPIRLNDQILNTETTVS